MTILVVTWSGDSEVVRGACDEIERRGERCFRLDTDRAPVDLSIAIESSTRARGASLRADDRSVDAGDVRAVWYRRMRPAAGLPGHLSPSVRTACAREFEAALHGWLATTDAFEIDRADCVARASHKPVQLAVARELGLDVPRTLVTNDAAAARAFHDDCGGRIIAKPSTQFRIDDGDASRVVLTSPVDRRDLDDAGALALSPMIFQERLEKRLELRVAIVGREAFAAAIDSSASARTEVDWRAGARELVGRWTDHALPHDVAERSIGLVERFGLHFGALDFVLTPEGRYVFLEINPQGEFAWLELAPPRLPISRAIAAALVDGARAR